MSQLLDTEGILSWISNWIYTKLRAKQDKLTFDNEPTANSSNPVKSGGVYTATNNLSSAVNGINAKIPSAASSSNQLADKAYLASQISGFITKSVNDLTYYYLKSETYTKQEVQSLIAAVKQFTYQLADVLPTASASTMNIIYLVPSADPQQQNVKDEFITIATTSGGTTTYSWEQIGSTAIDLSGYYTSAQTDAAITAALNTALANYYTSTQVDAAITTALGSYYTKTQTDTLLAAKEAVANKVTTIDGDSTDTQYPSAKAVHDLVEDEKDDIDAKLDGKANNDGYYGEMTVGSAENLVGRGTVEADYNGVRTTAGTEDIGSGSATITKHKGNSVKFNQLISNISKNGRVYPDTNFTQSYTNGLYTLQNTSGSQAYAQRLFFNMAALRTIVGHVYQVRIFIENCSGITFDTGLYGLIDLGGKSFTISLPLTTGQYITRRIVASGDSAWVTLNGNYVSDKYVRFDVNAKLSFRAVLSDLTQIFGEGNEPATVEEFEEWLAENVGKRDYYPYTAGAILNNGATGIKTRGFNLYDYATGKAYLCGSYSDYEWEYEICGTFESISYTDVNGNTYVPELHDGRFFNVENAGELTVVGGNNTDTLVHMVWSGWRNEGEPDYQFEPYWESLLQLNLKTITGKLNGTGESQVIFPYGLAKICNVQDEIVGDTATKRIGRRAYEQGDESDSTVMTDGTNTQYVLSTPEIYTLDEELPMKYRVDDFGTEEAEPAYTDELNANIRYDVQYAMNAVDAIRRLPANLESKEDKSNKVTSLSSESTDEQYPSAKAVFDSVKEVSDTAERTGVYDVTANNSGATFASLNALLSDANILIPTAVRHGGMEIRFVNSSDNNYVQFRYMLPYGGNTTAENNKFVNPTNWQGVDDVPTAGSSNLVKSGGVTESILSFKEDWDNTVNFKAKIAGTGFLFNDPTANCKIFTISDGDQIKGKGGSSGSYFAILKEMPIYGVSTIPFATGYSSRFVVNANNNFSYSIDSEDAKYIIVEESRTESSVLYHTKPASISLNNISLLTDKAFLLNTAFRNLKQGIFVPRFGSYILITSTTITIPSGSRIIYNNTYYLNNTDVVLNRSDGAQYDIVVFDTSDNSYKALIASYDFVDSTYLFCFYVRNNGDCSLNSSLYKTDGSFQFVLNSQYNTDTDLTNKKLSNAGNTSYPCKNNRYIGGIDGTATLMTGLELIKGNRYRVELKSDTAFTITATSAVKIYSADSETTVLQVANIKDVEINNNIFEFVWPNDDVSNYRIGIYAFVSGTYKLDIKVLNLGAYTIHPDVIPSIWKDNCYIEYTGSIVNSTDWCVSQKFKCKYGDTISWKSGSTTSNYTISMVIFDATGTKLGYLSNGTGVNRSLALTDASLYEDADYVIASFYKPAKNGYIKIDDGENATEFIFNSASSEIILDTRGEIDDIKEEAYRLKDNDIILGNKHKESSLVNTLLYNGSSGIKVNNKLSLLHFTDLHGDPVNLARIVEFRNYYDDYLDDCIHTGDSVTGTIDNANVFTRVGGAETILNVAGNHEAWLQATDPDYYATEKQVYDKMFAPSIANWNVVQPTDAATNGQCYYYKDYRNYRLIVLDNVHWHTRNGVSDDNPTQKTWFESVLSDAATNNKIVVCAMHYPPVNIVPLSGAGGFNDYGTTDSTVIGDEWFAKDEIFDCVDTFITNNGIFACWLVGHTHKDYVGYVKEHTNQPIVVLRNAGLYSYSGTNKNVSGTAAQDCFNVITFSWVNSSMRLIKITRIGNDMDMYDRSKKTLCFNTVDGTVLYAG